MQVGEITFSNVVCVLKVCILMLVIKTKAKRNRVYNIYMNTTNQILQIDLSIFNTLDNVYIKKQTFDYN